MGAEIPVVATEGAAAGFALQSKLTYVAAGAAGFLWLLYQRKWRSLAIFVMSAALTSLGIYACFLVREPHMLEHLFVLHSAVPNVAGLRKLIYQLGMEPILLLDIAMLPALLCRRWLERSPGGI